MILLKDIIDEFMLEASDIDNYVNRINRTLVLKHAKRSLEEMAYAVQPEIRTVQFELPSYKFLDWPIGAIDVLRIMIVDTDGQLTPVYVNNQNPIAFEYIKDSNGSVVLDDLNQPIKAEVDPAIQVTTDGNKVWQDYPYQMFYGRKYGLRGGVIGRGGQYRYEHETGRIYFFDLPEGQKIIMDYMVNPLVEKYEDELNVPEYIRKPLENYIYYQIIRRRRNVPASEKERAKREYFRELKQAKKRILINPQEILQALKQQRATLAW